MLTCVPGRRGMSNWFFTLFITNFKLVYMYYESQDEGRSSIWIFSCNDSQEIKYEYDINIHVLCFFMDVQMVNFFSLDIHMVASCLSGNG